MLMNVNGLLNGFSIEQRKWLIARLLTTSDAAAARAIGVHPSTVCRWPEKAELERAIAELLEDPQNQAIAIFLDALPKAARIKVGGLGSRKEQIQQAAASEIVDRVMGKPTQKQEIETGEVTIRVVYGPDGKAEGTA